jgi:hypothetical protein
MKFGRGGQWREEKVRRERKGRIGRKRGGEQTQLPSDFFFQATKDLALIPTQIATLTYLCTKKFSSQLEVINDIDAAVLRKMMTWPPHLTFPGNFF